MRFQLFHSSLHPQPRRPSDFSQLNVRVPPIDLSFRPRSRQPTTTWVQHVQLYDSNVSVTGRGRVVMERAAIVQRMAGPFLALTPNWRTGRRSELRVAGHLTLGNLEVPTDDPGALYLWGATVVVEGGAASAVLLGSGRAV